MIDKHICSDLEVTTISGGKVHMDKGNILNNFLKMGLFIVILISLSGCGLLMNTPIELTHDIFTFEYGEQIQLSVHEVLDTEDEDILNSAKISYEIDKEDDNSHLAVGEYTAYVIFVNGKEERQLDFTIEVVDTTPPSVQLKEDLETISITVGTSEFDIESFIVIDELSEYSIDFDDSSLDLDTEGNYELSVVVTDTHDNVTVFDFTVVVEARRVSSTPLAEINKRVGFTFFGPHFSTTQFIYAPTELKKSDAPYQFTGGRINILDNGSGGIDPKVGNTTLLLEEDGYFIIREERGYGNEVSSGNIFEDISDEQWMSVRDYPNTPIFTVDTKEEFTVFLNLYFNEFDIKSVGNAAEGYTDLVAAASYERVLDYEEAIDSFDSNQIQMFSNAPNFKFMSIGASNNLYYLVTHENQIYTELRRLDIFPDEYNDIVDDPQNLQWQFDERATQFLKESLENNLFRLN